MRKSLVLTFVMLLFADSAYADGWTVQTINLKAKPQSLTLKKNRKKLSSVRILTEHGERLRVRPCGNQFCVKPVSRPARKRTLPRRALPDSIIARGKKNIRSAFLGDATQRYGHGVLGDKVEAGALYVFDRRKKKYKLTLGLDSVFEDLHARLADVDKDGADEIIVVRSYLTKGASLAVVELGKIGLSIAAETPAIGRPFRWLNPAGVADFDGDGWPEIALVVTPHIGGTLQLWRYRSKKLERNLSLNDVSNHAKGSRILDMTAIVDFDGDKIKDLAIPDASRRNIRVLSFAGGQAKERALISLPGHLVTEILWVRTKDSKKWVLVGGLDNGRLAIMTPPASPNARRE